MALSATAAVKAYARTSVALVVKHRRWRHLPDAIRYAPAWFRTQRRGTTPLDDRQPWMVFRAIDLLDRHLEAGMSVFEYGPGGSTAFFLDHGCEVVSVEHDADWIAALRGSLTAGGAWTLHERPEAHDLGEDPRDPYAYGSTRGGHHGAYVQTIDAYGEFDVIVVDGRARPACLRHAIPHVAPGGLLVLDNAERATYRYALGVALVEREGWPSREFFGPNPYGPHFSATRTWQRPETPGGPSATFDTSRRR